MTARCSKSFCRRTSRRWSWSRLLRRLLRGLALVGCTVVLLLRDARHLAAADDLDRVDHRRIERKDALHALAVGNLAHGETFVEARAGAPDADALIGLDAAALALDHLVIDEDGVARSEIRDFLARGKLRNLLFFELLNEIHGNSPSAAPMSRGARAYRLFGPGELLRHPAVFVTRPVSSRAVIPGRPEGPGPESITPGSDYGFQARRPPSRL